MLHRLAAQREIASVVCQRASVRRLKDTRMNRKIAFSGRAAAPCVNSR